MQSNAGFEEIQNHFLHATFVASRQVRIFLQDYWTWNTIEATLEFQV